MSKENLVVFDQVDKSIKKNKILEDISFDLKKGEVIGIIGRNGSGKTTILRLASGLSYPTKGRVIVNNREVSPGTFGEMPTEVGVLIESPIFLENLTGFENLNLLSKIKNKINKNVIYTAIKQVGLNPEDNKKVRQYSLGMKQRLGIAQAIMEDPSVVLFDEPTNGLDEEGLDLFEQIINDYKAKGTGFIFVSHRTDEIEKFCDRVFQIEDHTLTLHREKS